MNFALLMRNIPNSSYAFILSLLVHFIIAFIVYQKNVINNVFVDKTNYIPVELVFIESTHPEEVIEIPEEGHLESPDLKKPSTIPDEAPKLEMSNIDNNDRETSQISSSSFIDELIVLEPKKERNQAIFIPPPQSPKIETTVPRKPSKQTTTNDSNSRWILAPDTYERAEDGAKLPHLVDLGEGLKCLKSTEHQCQVKRYSILGESAKLSETDKVWTQKLAFTGLPSEFYGLSEREIYQKLNISIAGENGLYIPFTSFGIDGQWWDSSHGVKKHCKYVAAGKGEFVKVCPKVSNEKNGKVYQNTYVQWGVPTD